jgi:hypothetical protein
MNKLPVTISKYPDVRVLHHETSLVPAQGISDFSRCRYNANIAIDANLLVARIPFEDASIATE